VLVPAPANKLLPVFKSEVSDQLVPFHNSVCAYLEPSGALPPKAKAAVFDAPVPDSFALAVFKSLTSVQLVPFHNSVAAESLGSCPPKAKADVLVPAPAKDLLAVFKSLLPSS